jgi:hypothetical protein
MIEAIASGEQPPTLDRHVAVLNRLDTALVAAAMAGRPPPSARQVFDALCDASIASAEVIGTYGTKPIPDHLRSGLLRLHCAFTDLTASLKHYTRPAVRGLLISRRHHPLMSSPWIRMFPLSNGRFNSQPPAAM